jgi:hypothetical protein
MFSELINKYYKHLNYCLKKHIFFFETFENQNKKKIQIMRH